MSKEPSDNIGYAAEIIGEAARLYNLLGDMQESKHAVACGLQWRYGIQPWEAKEAYEAATKVMQFIRTKARSLM